MYMTDLNAVTRYGENEGASLSGLKKGMSDYFTGQGGEVIVYQDVYEQDPDMRI